LSGYAAAPQAPVPLVLTESVPRNARIGVASTALRGKPDSGSDAQTSQQSHADEFFSRVHIPPE